MKKYVLGSIVSLLVLMSFGAFKQSPKGIGELATVQETWTTLGTITASQATLAVGGRDYATVDALATTKTVTFEPQIWANDMELRFQTTADADAHVVEMWIARGRTDHYDLAAVLTLTGGKQVADGAYVFVDTITATETFSVPGTIIHSAADSIARYDVNLDGYSRVVFIATTLECSSTLTIQSALQSNSSGTNISGTISAGGLATSALQLADGHNVTVDNAAGTAAVEVQMTSPVRNVTITGVDAWQSVVAATVVVGAVADFSDAYGDSMLYVEIAQVEAVAHDGGNMAIVQVSFGDDDWIDYTTLSLTADTAGTTTVNDATADADDTTITLTDSATADFDVKARKWYIKDGTIANSESVYTIGDAAHTVTLASGLVRSHANGLNVYDRVDDFAVAIVEGVAAARVLYNNQDADCNVDVRSYLNKMTAR